MWVDNVRLIAGDGKGELTLANKIGVGAKAIRTGGLFFAGRPEKTPLTIVNSDTQAHRLAVKTNITDCEGNQLSPVDVGTFDLPAGGTRETSLAIDTSRRGTFRLGFELTTEGQTWREDAQLKYAVIVPLKDVGNAGESAFGMNTHMEREPSPHLAHSMDVLSQCGVKWIRAWWGWGMCEKDRGTFDWTEYDRQLSPVEGAGMKIMPILLRYYPQYEQAWAGELTGIQRPPYKMEEWGALVRKVAERYKGRVTAWELWNEPTMDNAGFTPQHKAGKIQVVGFFRSHTRKGLALDAEDLQFLEARFRSAYSMALLVRPFATKASVGGIFLREGGGFNSEPSALEFPFRSAQLTPSRRVTEIASPPTRAQVVPIATRREISVPPPPPPAALPPLEAVAETVVEEPAPELTSASRVHTIHSNPAISRSSFGASGIGYSIYLESMLERQGAEGLSWGWPQTRRIRTGAPYRKGPPAIWAENYIRQDNNVWFRARGFLDHR